MDKDRFCQLWSRCGGADAEPLFAEMARYYAAPGRYYHTGAHIDECLARMDSAAAALGRADSVELALWFHDVIYIAGDPENERLSAEWFVARAGGLAAELVGEVERHIISTIHDHPPSDPHAQFVVDTDLGGMGESAQAFRRDGANIRKEFAALTDAEYLCGQNAFLRNLLARERIFYTDYFHERCEANARRNISETLAAG